MANWQERFDRLLKGMASGEPHKAKKPPFDPDNPMWTAEDFAKARPASDFGHDLVRTRQPAREDGADEDEGRGEERLKKIAKAKPSDDK